MPDAPPPTTPPAAIIQPARPAQVAPVRPFDLATVKPAPVVCGQLAPDGGIVVCAVDREQFRVHPLGGPFANPAPPLAQVELSPGVKAQAEAEQRTLPGGASAPAAMVHFKIDF
jgi:hypothetical protein